jgi:protein ImuA
MPNAYPLNADPERPMRSQMLPAQTLPAKLLPAQQSAVSAAGAPLAGKQLPQRNRTGDSSTGDFSTGDSSLRVQQLAQEIRQLETAGRRMSAEEAISTGSEALDACLPHGGYVRGSVIEFLRATPACGAAYLAYSAAAAAMQATAGFLVVVDVPQSQAPRSQAPHSQAAGPEPERVLASGQRSPAQGASPSQHRAAGRCNPSHFTYPPALAAHGIDLQKVIFVRPASWADALWTVDQSLRTSAVAAVVAELDRMDDRAARRLQLAAEAGGSLALLLRSAQARRHPSWAEVQWLVRSQALPQHLRPAGAVLPSDGNVFSARPTSSTAGRQLHVQLLRSRGGRSGASMCLHLDPVTGAIRSVSAERNRYEQTASVHLASQLARPTTPSRRAAAS